MSTPDHYRINPGIPISAVQQARGKKLKPDEIAREVIDRRQASIHAYEVERRYQWSRNHHMVYGNQWLDWNPVLKRHTQKPVLRDRKVVLNHLRMRVEARIGKLLSARPSFTALPHDRTEDGHRAAVFSERLLEFAWFEHDLFAHRYFAQNHETIFGAGIIKTWYDPNCGQVETVNRMVADPTGMPIDAGDLARQQGEMLDQDPMDIAKRELKAIQARRWKGKVKVSALHPARLHPPPDIPFPLLTLCPWLVEDIYMSVEEIKDVFDVAVSGSADHGEATDFSEDVAHDLTNFTFNRWTSAHEGYGRVRVAVYYQPPAPVQGFERGKVYYVADNQVLNGPDGEPSQFSDGRYPFAMLSGYPYSGRFWPMPWVTPLIDAQISYNQTRTRQRRWEALMFAPYILNPSTSGIPETWFSGGYKVLTYQAHGGKPEFWQPPVPPTAAYQSLARDLEDMDMIGAQFGFSRGQQQQGSPSAALAQLMVEADASELGPLISLHARAWEQVGGNILELYRRWGQNDIVMQALAVDGYPEQMSFSRLDIPASIRVRVQEESLMPVIKGARVETTKGLVREGFYGDPMQMSPGMRTQLLKHMGQPVGRMGVDDASMLERRYAERENFHIIEMQQDVPNRPGFENDQLHLEVHLERLNQSDAMTWGPDVYERMKKHIGLHQQAIQQQQEQQMQMQIQQAEEMQRIQTEGKIREAIASKGSAEMAKVIAGGGNGEMKAALQEAREKDEAEA